jgi:hypothetical protein
MTVSQAKIAIVHMPMTSLFIRTPIPAPVISSGLRLKRPAKPPANAKRKIAPNTIPWSTVQNSLSVIVIVFTAFQDDPQTGERRRHQPS